ncbi:MAG: hypothetical protein M0P01_02870 [Treponema sp.]|nr:hypothetical protein [Treponema sp.]
MDNEKSNDPGEIDRIPELVAAGKLTENEAVNLIAKEIYQTPFRFGLAGYDEDFRSEVLLSFLQKGSFILERYIPERSNFRSYLFASVQGFILTQKRNQIRKMVSDTNVKHYIATEDQEYEKKESGHLSVSCPHVKYQAVSNENIWRTMSARCRQVGTSNAKTALILALKSSYYIPADYVDDVSSFCSLESAELHRLIIELNSLLYAKIKRRNLIVERRNNAYYFHRKYFMQMKYCNHEKTNMETLSQKYSKQTENWQNKNKLLQKSRYRVCPTNKMIAKILGICERQVGYYIKRAKGLDKENKLIV